MKKKLLWRQCNSASTVPCEAAGSALLRHQQNGHSVGCRDNQLNDGKFILFSNYNKPLLNASVNTNT